MLIAGTNTPLSLVALPPEQARSLIRAARCLPVPPPHGRHRLPCREGRLLPPPKLASSRQPSCTPPRPPQSNRLLAIVWGGALVGIAQCLFFSRAPKAVGVTL